MCICEDKEKIESVLTCILKITAVLSVWQEAIACADSLLLTRVQMKGR